MRRIYFERQLFANVEALGALLAIPVESVPVRSVARSVCTCVTARLAATDVLLAVDDAVGTTRAPTQISAARPFQSHA
jgi:hypothetical protein